MRLYLDQMFHPELAALLAAEGHDVICAAEQGLVQADDAAVLAQARREGRVLVTLDQHFGNYAVLPLGRHAGVIRLRTHPTTAENAAELLLPFLAEHSREELQDTLVILSPRSERWRRTA